MRLPQGFSQVDVFFFLPIFLAIEVIGTKITNAFLFWSTKELADLRFEPSRSGELFRLRVVPHFSSGIVERAKGERAWKSPSRVSPFLARVDFHARSFFARSTHPWEKTKCKYANANIQSNMKTNDRRSLNVSFDTFRRMRWKSNVITSLLVKSKRSRLFGDFLFRELRTEAIRMW